MAAIEAARTSPVYDLTPILRHNRTLAAFETLSGIPTRPVTSIQEWDELEERLGVLLG